MASVTDVVAYTYKADEYCPDCIKTMYNGLGDHLSTAEQVLDIAAKLACIDRYDERTYNSGDFPKVIFRGQIEGKRHCGSCSELLG